MPVEQVAHRGNFTFLERGDHKRSAVFIADLEMRIELLLGYRCDTEMRMVDSRLVSSLFGVNRDLFGDELNACLFFAFSNRGGDDVRIYRLDTSSW